MNRTRLLRDNCDTRRRGVALMFITIMLVVLLGMVAMAVDIGYVVLTRTQLQVAADAAALAGAAYMGQSREAVVAAARKFAAYHTAAGKPVELADSDVEFGTWNSGTRVFTPTGILGNAIRVTARRDAAHGGSPGLFFGRVLGRFQFTSRASAVAVANPRDIAFVVDLSGSMNDDSEPCWATAEINRTFASSGYGTIGSELVAQLFQDLGYGAYPGRLEWFGQPFGVPKTKYAYAELTKDGGPLTLRAVPARYRILPTDSELVRKRKAYSAVIDYQIAALMPRAKPTPDSSVNYAYWEKYLDYILEPVTPPRPPRKPIDIDRPHPGSRKGGGKGSVGGSDREPGGGSSGRNSGQGTDKDPGGRKGGGDRDKGGGGGDRGTGGGGGGAPSPPLGQALPKPFRAIVASGPVGRVPSAVQALGVSVLSDLSDLRAEATDACYTMGPRTERPAFSAMPLGAGAWPAMFASAVLSAPVVAPAPASTRRGWLPPEQDPDRITGFNNPNPTTFPSARRSVPASYRNRLGYLTYVQFMLDFGRDLKPDDRTYVPLSPHSPLCPYHSEDTAGGSFRFPPRTQPVHAARRALIAAIQVVRERNTGLDPNQSDWVSVISFDSLAGGGPVVHQELTSDYKAAMEACTRLEAVGDKAATTATEAGLLAARRHIEAHSAGGQGRENANKVVVLLTDGVPNLYVSSPSEIDTFIQQNPKAEFYGGGRYWYDAALMQTLKMQAAGWQVFPVGVGLGTDYTFMDRLARLGGTADDNGQSPRGTGNPAEYEQRLTDIFKRIITSPRVRLVQ